MEAVWAFSSVAVVSLVSLIGAVGLSFGLLSNHRVMMALIALAAGTLLGDAALHLLPEAGANGFTSRIGWFVLFGFLAMFGIETVLRRGHSHGEHFGEHDHAEAHAHGVQPFGWVNLVGDGLHNLLDGIIIAAAFLIDTTAGVATASAVLLHEIPQELGDFAVLVRSGMSVPKALLLNLASALLAFLGAGMVFLADIDPDTLATTAVPLIAGAFIYIAAADLIPELHHHTARKDILLIVAALAVGLVLMGLLLDLESVLPVAHEHD